jgi:hypothetical protein
MRSLFLSLFLSLLVVLGTATPVMAQVDAKITVDSLAKVPELLVDSIPWKWRTIWGAGFSTVQLNNWTGGGQDAVSIRLLMLGSLDYATKGFSWDNDIELGYGLAKIGSQSFRKNDDRIIVSSRAALRQSKHFKWAAFTEFRTQFYSGRNYDVIDSTTNDFLEISNFMAPAYLTGALGLEYTPVSELKILVAPVSSRSTFVESDRIIEHGITSGLGAFGLAPGVRSRTDVGAVVNASLDWEMFQNVRWRGRFNAFMPYETPALWVVTVENAFLLKVNNWLNVSLLTDVFYNDRIPVVRDDGSTGPATQLRNQLVVGINWSIANF